jgi:threonine/homoserine/homoserine lactone efflux protein
MDLEFLIRGLIIGFTVAAQVGPMCILCIRRTLTLGLTVGLVSGLGVALADAIYAAIGGFGLTAISNLLISLQFWLRLIGGLFLIYIGFKAFVAEPAERAAKAKQTNSLFGLFSSTLFLTLTNPMTIISFTAIFAGLGLAETGGNFGAASFLVTGVFAGSCLWWVILLTGVSLFRKSFTPNIMRWINRLSGVVIIAFGFWAVLGLFF